MTEVGWTKIKHFTPGQFDDPEFPGSGEQIDPVVPMFLEELRAETGWPIVVHWKVGGAVDLLGTHGHSHTSLHKVANGAGAVDWHFETKEPIQAQIKAVLHTKFNGIGVYYDWGIPVGFHTDVRPAAKYQVWLRIAGSYIYLVRNA